MKYSQIRKSDNKNKKYDIVFYDKDRKKIKSHPQGYDQA